MRRSPVSTPLWVFSAAMLMPLGGCGGMSTYGTGQVPEMALFREMSGGILNKNNKKEPIDYQPRAPLVMPPAAETAAAPLPAPMETASAASPDWPMSREDRVGDATARAEDDNPYNDVNQAEYRRLRPLAGVFPDQQSRPTYELDESGKSEYYNNIVHDRRQREEFKKALAESKGYGSSERRYLTDPPLAYRDPVPSAATGEEAVLPKKKKGNFLTRWWGGG